MKFFNNFSEFKNCVCNFLEFKSNLLCCATKDVKFIYKVIALIIIFFGLICMIFNPIVGLYILIIPSVMWRLLCEVVFKLNELNSKTNNEINNNEINEQDNTEVDTSEQ